MDETREDLDSLVAAVARIPARDLSVPPAQLDEYKLIRPLGHGGMGSVWLAHDQLLDRLVAIKLIAHMEPTARDRFALEARAAARLQHANVVSVYRFGEHAGRPFLVAEYIRGESLDQLAKPVPPQRVLELGVGLARGLAAAHRRGIVHRDIKPANAILAEDGEPKLVDFGLAKFGEAGMPVPALVLGTSPLTAPGAIAGTPLYLAPEVRAGKPATQRSDVYQLGAILYELVTGRAPLLDVPGGPEAASTADVPSLGDSALGAIIDRCLRRDPAARYPSGEELREALERLAAPALGGELPAGNPYRGLVAFEARDRALFFGRGPGIRAVVERLRSDTFVVITGDSGVGKSSLARAGVLPHVVDGALRDGRTWRAATMVPGQHPLRALATALQLDESALTDDPGAAIRRALGDKGGLILFIDQLEELVTLADPVDAVETAFVIERLAAGIPGVRVLATLRGDFVSRVDIDLSRALYVLRPLTEEGRREAIVGPARATGARFESDALIDALVAEHAELPLLEFTLAQLWDARDTATQTIDRQSLDAIGGVRGALARHADAVIAALVPPQRAAAKRILLRLVTEERTRARCGADELGGHADVLDALVRGRLVVARGDDPPLFELAHERLIDSWPMLAEWLSRTAEQRATHARLAAAVASWERLDHSPEALWRERQLADTAGLDLTRAEAAFVAASRRAVTRRRRLKLAAIIAVPAIIAGSYATARIVEHRNVTRAIDDRIQEANGALATARLASRMFVEERNAAVAAFSERAWQSALALESQAQASYTAASSTLEAALLLDASRRDVRAMLAEVTLERLRHADATFRDEQRDELRSRLAVYDRDGSFMREVDAPAHLVLAIDPPDATITIDNTPVTTHALDVAPGAYVVIASAPGRASVRAAILAKNGETKNVAFALPPAASVPAGFVYVPPGEFLEGSRDAEPVRRFYGAPPMHVRRTDGFLIAQTEVTYADWIAFLDALSPEERKQRAPHVETSITIQDVGGVQLTQDDGGWKLAFSPADQTYKVRSGEPIVYPDRTLRARQDWSRMPVTGITPDDVDAYARWLDRTHRVPHARLCHEYEWERAARGADGRTYPHGKETLDRDDANIDITYGQRGGAFGPDEVGSHPATQSPFGLYDTAGNVWEITRSDTGNFVMRGGSFYTNADTAVLANRFEKVTADVRGVLIGVRMCADL